VGQARPNLLSAARDLDRPTDDGSLAIPLLIFWVNRDMRVYFRVPGPDSIPIPDSRASSLTFSQDREWWWDGTSWQSAVSADRAWRWTGVAWVPNAPGPGATPKASQAHRPRLSDLITPRLKLGLPLL
jgi:hypothetical protein